MPVARKVHRSPRDAQERVVPVVTVRVGCFMFSDSMAGRTRMRRQM